MQENWDEYIKGQAEDYGVPLGVARMLFDLLGPSEAYDGFVTHLEDYADEHGESDEWETDE